ncbi:MULTISPECIES: nucleoside diphosphate kinase regulator [unclassified Pseudoalteromonas]|uniref:nucleoside diphosphate kinase regulator n=1 Tax=unclassified Pseudoalteromonas TaxID=194690 RepID=UPI0025B5B1FA|nr:MULTISPECIES: nucleoside diphosphate kinase regulator [unclassified Pseudoalteromonas]MDN3379348.1 nucleoside diphosphate kinase regulator [Pseudoalteromonas sp. APC 3893]MDN3386522.1 nucleoside diphosphate kinase regulator [Pseudoalteromonas sp. APC 4017]
MNKKPELIISSLDADRLYELMESLPAGSFAGEKELEAELGRATIVEPKDMPSTVVTMNSTVNFIVESTQEEFTKTLVYPKNADANGDKISILAPVGSALLGLSQGDKIEWPKPSGGVIKVKIKAVTYQPERVGELHR